MLVCGAQTVVGKTPTGVVERPVVWRLEWSRGWWSGDWSGQEAGGLETRVVERPVILWTNMPKPEFTYTSEQNRVNEKKTSFYLEKRHIK